MCDFDEKSCEIKNSELGVSYNLKKATFGNEGKIKVSKHMCTHWFKQGTKPECIPYEHWKKILAYETSRMVAE